MRWLRTFLEIVLTGILCCSAASAATLKVEMSGVDSGTCGPVSPCRSISQAVTNAAPGDKIKVGPGLYSDDVDDDGSFDEAGEEPSATGVNVDKTVRIETTDGAASTLIRKVSGQAVSISADGVIFGKRNKGFTISIRAAGGGISNAGNDTEISGHVIYGTPGGSHIGITQNGNFGYVHDNRVFCALNSDHFTGLSIGILLNGAGARIDRNVVSDCPFGDFFLSGTASSITRNVVIGGANGYYIPGSTVAFTGNASYGGANVFVAGPSQGPFRSNTMVGSNLMNCGLRNDSAGNVDAVDNYWGSAAGPGLDPADEVCDTSTGITTVAPFATKDLTKPQAALR